MTIAPLDLAPWEDVGHSDSPPTIPIANLVWAKFEEDTADGDAASEDDWDDDESWEDEDDDWDDEDWGDGGEKEGNEDEDEWD